MPRKPLLAIFAAMLAALSLGLAACGDDDEPAADAPPPAAETTATAPAPPATTAAPDAGGQPTVVELNADPGGQLAWVETTLSAPAGEVTISLTNDSSVPHNVAIEGGASTGEVSDTITDGGTAAVTEDLAAGEYVYYCAIGGHRAAGMEGTLTVE